MTSIYKKSAELFAWPVKLYMVELSSQYGWIPHSHPILGSSPLH